MDIFDSKSIKPMLIGEMQDAFDDPDWIYELKLDGVRCLAYLNSSGTELRNKRNLRVGSIYPELSYIHKQVRQRCILDGELVVMKDGKPDFSEIQRRALMTNAFRIELAASKLPVSFTAFDLLYLENQQLTDRPLMERKKLLAKSVKENERLAISRYIEKDGVALYDLAEKQGLEGIVAKRKDSRYYFDKHTKGWIKVKNLLDDDFVVLGYINKEKNVTSIVLGQYASDQLDYKGHVTLGISSRDFQIISSQPKIQCPFPVIPKGNEAAQWVSPELVCTVKYMEKTANGGLRQPVFKGLRDDKLPKECIISKNKESL